MIQLIILLGIISIIDFSTKKIPVVVLVVMGQFRIHPDTISYIGQAYKLGLDQE